MLYGFIVIQPVHRMQKRRKLTTCTGMRPKDMVITTNVQLNLLIPSTTGSQSNTNVIIQFQKITCALTGTRQKRRLKIDRSTICHYYSLRIQLLQPQKTDTLRFIVLKG